MSTIYPACHVISLSVQVLARSGIDIRFSSPRCYVYDTRNVQIGEGTLLGMLYRLHCVETTDQQTPYQGSQESHEEGSVFLTVKEERAKLWHQRLNHIGMASLLELSRKQLVDGIDPDLRDPKHVCEGCVAGKDSRKPFPAKDPTKRSAKPLEVVHTDLCGPMGRPTKDGGRYFITFTDDFSRRTTTRILVNKGDALQAFKEYKTVAENLTGTRSRH